MQAVAFKKTEAPAQPTSMLDIVRSWHKKKLVPISESRKSLPFALIGGKHDPATLAGSMTVIRRHNNTVLFMHAGQSIEEPFEDQFLLSLVLWGQKRFVSIRLVDKNREVPDKRTISIDRQKLKEMLLAFGIMNESEKKN